MRKRMDKEMLKSALTMSGLFTLLVCIVLFLISNEPYLIYDVGKTIKTGDLPPIMFTIGMGLVVLFVVLSATLFSIAYYKRGDVTRDEEKIKKRVRKRRKIKKNVKAEEVKKEKRD